MKGEIKMNDDKLDSFTKAYIACALWSSNDDDCEPLNDNYSIEEISPECLQTIIDDCKKFQADNFDIISTNLTGAGRDFWLTRNGLGDGFWAGDWPENGERLTAYSETFKECDLYVGDDGLIYC